jgi:hypothetical protein
MKTIKKIPLKIVQIESGKEIPWENLEENILYIGEYYSNYYKQNVQKMNHLCLCGCGRLISLDLNVSGSWKYTKNSEEKVTITPSILNEPCMGHYVINDGIGTLLG